jgi:hypothetical protein
MIKIKHCIQIAVMYALKVGRHTVELQNFERKNENHTGT